MATDKEASVKSESLFKQLIHSTLFKVLHTAHKITGSPHSQNNEVEHNTSRMLNKGQKHTKHEIEQGATKIKLKTYN